MQFHPVPPARRQSQPLVAQQFLEQRKSLKLPISSLAVGMPGIEPPTPPKRRVSIASDPVTVAHCPGGYDNQGFEGSLHPRRKVRILIIKTKTNSNADVGLIRYLQYLNIQHMKI